MIDTLEDRAARVVRLEAKVSPATRKQAAKHLAQHLEWSAKQAYATPARDALAWLEGYYTSVLGPPVFTDRDAAAHTRKGTWCGGSEAGVDDVNL